MGNDTHYFQVTVGDGPARVEIEYASTPEAAAVGLFPRVLEQARAIRDMAVIEYKGSAVAVIDGARAATRGFTGGAFLYGPLGEAIQRAGTGRKTT